MHGDQLIFTDKCVEQQTQSSHAVRTKTLLFLYKAELTGIHPTLYLPAQIKTLHINLTKARWT